MARNNSAANIALGGVLAALAVTVTCLGGMIPMSTFVCPMLSMLILTIVLRSGGARTGWAWYGAVAILGALLSPDKEAAAVFVSLGYYPIVKPKLDKLPLRWLWKAMLFNAVILLMYWVLMHIFGMAQLVQEFADMGTAMTLVTLLLGNATFFLLDRLLSIRFKL